MKLSTFQKIAGAMAVAGGLTTRNLDFACVAVGLFLLFYSLDQ